MNTFVPGDKVLIISKANGWDEDFYYKDVLNVIHTVITVPDTEGFIRVKNPTGQDYDLYVHRLVKIKEE